MLVAFGVGLGWLGGTIGVATGAAGVAEAVRICPCCPGRINACGNTGAGGFGGWRNAVIRSGVAGAGVVPPIARWISVEDIASPRTGRAREAGIAAPVAGAGAGAATARGGADDGPDVAGAFCTGILPATGRNPDALATCALRCAAWAVPGGREVSTAWLGCAAVPTTGTAPARSSAVRTTVPRERVAGFARRNAARCSGVPLAYAAPNREYRASWADGVYATLRAPLALCSVV